MAMTNRKLHGSLKSVATLKVLACLFEHNLDFEFVPVDLDSGEHKDQLFLDTLNPFGEVPVYEDGDVKQFESRGIIRSMAHQYGKKGEELIYWDPKQQAIVSNWVDVEDNHFEPNATKLIIAGVNRTDPMVEEAEAKLGEVLDIYEKRLMKFKYLASDKYTIVDLLHLPNLHALMSTKTKDMFASRPRVFGWVNEILGRPAWVKVLNMHSNY